MTDKKITDEEIIKRLEWCVKHGNRNYDTDIVLDLINRKMEEIERLKSELSNTRRKALLEASSKFAGHSNYHGDTILCKLICMAEGQEVDIATPLDTNEIKSEAYKEYHIKAKACLKANRDVEQQIGNNYVVKRIKEIENRFDNILKEMIGEEERI